MSDSEYIFKKCCYHREINYIFNILVTSILFWLLWKNLLFCHSTQGRSNEVGPLLPKSSVLVLVTIWIFPLINFFLCITHLPPQYFLTMPLTASYFYFTFHTTYISQYFKNVTDLSTAIGCYDYNVKNHSRSWNRIYYYNIIRFIIYCKFKAPLFRNMKYVTLNYDETSIWPWKINPGPWKSERFVSDMIHIYNIH